MELEVTWERVVRIWWAHCWRNLIGIVVAAILGGIIGFAVGLALGMMGVSKQVIMYVTTPLGFIMGLAISLVPMKLIIGKNFGEFRLVLVESAATE